MAGGRVGGLCLGGLRSTGAPAGFMGDRLGWGAGVAGLGTSGREQVVGPIAVGLRKWHSTRHS